MDILIVIALLAWVFISSANKKKARKQQEEKNRRAVQEAERQQAPAGKTGGVRSPASAAGQAHRTAAPDRTTAAASTRGAAKPRHRSCAHGKQHDWVCALPAGKGLCPTQRQPGTKQLARRPVEPCAHRCTARPSGGVGFPAGRRRAQSGVARDQRAAGLCL